MRYMPAILGILLLATPAFASSDNYIYAETRVFSDDSAHVGISITLDSPQQREIAVPISGVTDFSKVITEANFAGFSCRPVDSSSYDLLIVCDVSPITNSRGSFKIEFDSYSLMNSAGGFRKFHQQLIAPPGFKLARMQLKLILPEGSDMKDYTPSDPSIVSVAKHGTITEALWTKTDVLPTDLLDARATYVPSNTEVNLSVFYGIIIVLAVLAGSAFVYRRKLSPQMLMPVLKSDEKLVMESVLKHGGTAHQKIIVRESNYSKAKVSKVLKSLADRGIVKLERVGRSNKVSLSRRLKTEKQNAPGNN